MPLPGEVIYAISDMQDRIRYVGRTRLTSIDCEVRIFILEDGISSYGLLALIHEARNEAESYAKAQVIEVVEPGTGVKALVIPGKPQQ